MPWFKVDDNLAFHHKVVAAGNPAIGLWARAGAMCAQQLTDGFVPDHMAATLGTVAQARKLVEVGLWTRVNGGYKFHEWSERQPSRADVEAERAAAADRMRAHRERKKEAARKASPQVSGSRSPEQTPKFGGSSDEVRDSFGNPDPTRPDPTHKKDSCASTDVEREFADWWAAYPRKRGKGQALKAYRAALKKTDAGTLLAALKRQTPTLTARGDEYVPYPATWLNGERWADEPDNVRHLTRTDEQGRLVLPPLPGRDPWGPA